MDGDNKKAINVLNTDDIRKQAHEWTLAGDAGLLAQLEQFSEKIFEKAQHTHLKFNDLVESYEEVNKKIDNITNEFLALQNCQFVENRVYDDETPTEESSNEKVVDEEEHKRLLLLQYKEAVDIGIKLLDTHFQEVVVPPNSDSDDDEDTTTGNMSVIWKPKNPYAGKKSPLIIGSTEWWEDDKVGLGDYEQNLDTEKAITDSESDLEIECADEKQTQISSSSSPENEKSNPITANNYYTPEEDIFGIEKNYNFNRSSSDLFGVISVLGKSDISSKLEDSLNPNVEVENEINAKETHAECEDMDTNPNKINAVDNEFRKELAAKLGSFGKDDGVNSVKEKPSMPNVEKPSKKPINSDDLFGEIDDNDLFSENGKNVPIIGEKGLFDDDFENDANLFGGSNKLFSGNDLFRAKGLETNETTPSTTYENVIGEITNKVKQEERISKADKAEDLFGDVDDDDCDTLFSSKSVFKTRKDTSDNRLASANPGKTKSLLPSKGLFDDDSESDGTDEYSIFDKTSRKEKDDILSKKVEQDGEIFPTRNKEDEAISSSLEKPVGALATPPGFNSRRTVHGSSDSVKDTESETTQAVLNEETTDLFAVDVPEESKTTPTSKLISAVEDDDVSLFIGKPKNADALSISSNRSSLFDDIPASKTHLASLFEKDKSTRFDEDLFSSADNTPFGGTTLLNEDEDDLFSSKSESKTFNYSEKSDLFTGKSKKEENQTDLFLKKSKDAMEVKKKSDSKKVKEKNSLFDDFDDVDDLFGNAKDSEDIFATDSLFQKTPEKIFKKSPLPTLFPEVTDELSATDETDEAKIFDEISTDEKIDRLPKTGLEDLKSGSDILFDKVGISVPEGRNEENATEVTRHRTEAEKPSNKPAVAEKVKTINETSDLFNEETSSVIKVFPQKTYSDSGGDLFNEDDKAPAEVVITKPKPPDSLKLNVESTCSDNTSSNREKKISKLNIPQNLKSKLESVVKPTSAFDGKSNLPNKNLVDCGEDDKPDIPNTPPEPSTTLLKCPNKNRVKIQVRRRPQSRRARQEAIRNANTDFSTGDRDNPLISSSTTNIYDSKQTGDSRTHQGKESESRDKSLEPNFASPKSHPLSPSTDEEDIFNVPELDTNFENDDSNNLFKSNLFQAGKNAEKDENLLFDDAPVLSPHTTERDDQSVNPKEKTNSVFSFTKSAGKNKKADDVFNFEDDGFSDDDDDDDDGDSLFKSSGYTKMATKGGRNAFKAMSNAGVDGGGRKPLFDVELDKDDIDIFGENFGKSLTIETTAETVSKIPVVNAESKKKKEKKSPDFVDPLGLMTNNVE